MTSRFLLDSFAWIEYFSGSKQGEKVNELLEKESCYTPIIVFAELSGYYAKNNIGSWQKDREFIQSKTPILQMSNDLASTSGKLKEFVRNKYKNNFGLADAIILAAARSLGAKVVTGDHHFKVFKNVEFLE